MWKKEKVFARKKGTILQEDIGGMVCHFSCTGEEKWTPAIHSKERGFLKRLRTGQG